MNLARKGIFIHLLIAGYHKNFCKLDLKCCIKVTRYGIMNAVVTLTSTLMHPFYEHTEIP